MFRIIYIILSLCIITGCSTKYSQLNNQIDNAVTPTDIIVSGIDIASADISSDKKKKLSAKLAKKAVNIFKLYIEFALSGKKLPNKDEITNMIEYLSENIENFSDSDNYEQAKLILEKLCIILKDTYMSPK